MKYPLCPENCVFDPENVETQSTCSGCLHTKDFTFDPPRDGFMYGKDGETDVLVIAVNGNMFYIEQKMSNGETSLTTVNRDLVKFA